MEGCQRWGRSSAGAWEAGRGRATPRRTRHGGHRETGSLTDHDSSPAPGGPSEHTRARTHTHRVKKETGRVEDGGEQDEGCSRRKSRGVMEEQRGGEK